MLCHIEKLEFAHAAAYGRVCVAELNRTRKLFLDLAGLVENLRWLRDEVSRVDQALAAFEAGIPADLPELADAKAQMIRGNFHEVFRSCAEDLTGFSTDLESVIDSLDRLRDDPEKLEPRPVHGLLVRWRLLTIKGQQTSAAVAAAMTVAA